MRLVRIIVSTQIHLLHLLHYPIDYESISTHVMSNFFSS